MRQVLLGADDKVRRPGVASGNVAGDDHHTQPAVKNALEASKLLLIVGGSEPPESDSPTRQRADVLLELGLDIIHLIATGQRQRYRGGGTVADAAGNADASAKDRSHLTDEVKTQARAGRKVVFLRERGEEVMAEVGFANSATGVGDGEDDFGISIAIVARWILTEGYGDGSGGCKLESVTK
jgi:hypothetical protein